MKNPSAPVKLVPREKLYSSGVSKVLENVKTMVEQENITAIAVAAVDAKGFTHTLYEPGANFSTLIGAVERVKFRLLRHQEEI